MPLTRPSRGLLLTSFDQEEALAAAILAGAGGYIVKASPDADIIGAVRRLGGGRSMIDPALAEPVIAQLKSQIPIPPLTTTSSRSSPTSSRGSPIVRSPIACAWTSGPWGPTSRR